MKLKFKNLKEDAKDCFLCVDEMAIKTNLFYNLLKDLNIGFKIYYVFDAPYLLKSTRNNFFKYNLEVFNNMTDKK